MMYYVLDTDFSDYEGVIDYDIPEVWMDYPIYTTNQIPEDMPPIVFYVNKSNKMPDFLVNTVNYFIINTKLKSIIETYANDGLQFIQVMVLDKKTKTPIDNYFFYARILIKIDCINREKSVLTYNVRNAIGSIKSLSLNIDTQLSQSESWNKPNKQ